jgi:cell shape-determining protein MreD
MKRIGLVIGAFACLLLTAALQQSLAPRIAILGAAPDFILTLIGAASLFLSRGAAAFLGFLLGVAMGSLSGANMTHYVVSRTVAAFLAAWSRELHLEPHKATVFFTVFLTTVIARVVFMFLAAPSGIAGYLGATILSGIYNGLLGIPVYALLWKAFRPDLR